MSLLKGNRDYLLDQAEFIARLSNDLANAFERFGARRVIPSTFVALNLVSEPARAMVFADPHSGELMALRHDITSQIRQIVDEELKHLATPYKLFYLERVWGRDGYDKTRLQERLQAGLEWIGPGQEADVALLEFVLQVVSQSIPTRQPTLVLGHAALAPAWLSLVAEPLQAQLAHALQTKNHTQAKRLLPSGFQHLPWLVLEQPPQIEKLIKTPQIPVEAVAALTTLADIKQLLAKKVSTARIVIDPIAKAEASYYNGMWFQVVSGLAKDPWLRGGRYDGRFNTPVEALGFTVDLDALVDAHTQKTRLTR